MHQTAQTAARNAQSTSKVKNLNDVKSWNSTSITQFELAKVIYTSGFLNTCNLTATAKLVLMALIQHYNANNAEMFPSQRFLAQQLGISEKSVERAIANLSEEKYIYYVTQRVNRYRFTAYFFEAVKMSVMNRQNVGRGIRQNVGETNNTEKRKEKESFLTSEGGEESFLGSSNLKKGADAPQTSILKVDFKKNKKQKKCKKSDFSSAAQILKSFAKEPITEQNKLLEEFEKNQKSEQYRQKMLDALSGVVNAEENDEKQTSPYDLQREEALVWVRSLNPLLRVRGLAKELTQIHNFTEDELWSNFAPC